MTIKSILLKIKPLKYYAWGRNFLNDPRYLEVQRKSQLEKEKRPKRTEIINYLLSLQAGDTAYLEIGVRNPDSNYNHIRSSTKYSVDPGVEFKANPVDFKMTSDEFFRKVATNEILSKDIKFDVIFIDGLHTGPQVDMDIKNAIAHIKDDGFIVLHDCNPPTEWHARESYEYSNSPAHTYWNGTTWKGFLKWRFEPSVNSCCIDTDWGVGILSKNHPIGKSIKATNPFFEFDLMDRNRKEYLNLIDLDTLKTLLSK